VPRFVRNTKISSDIIPGACLCTHLESLCFFCHGPLRTRSSIVTRLVELSQSACRFEAKKNCHRINTGCIQVPTCLNGTPILLIGNTPEGTILQQANHFCFWTYSYLHVQIIPDFKTCVKHVGYSDRKVRLFGKTMSLHCALYLTCTTSTARLGHARVLTHFVTAPYQLKYSQMVCIKAPVSLFESFLRGAELCESA